MFSNNREVKPQFQISLIPLLALWWILVTTSATYFNAFIYYNHWSFDSISVKFEYLHLQLPLWHYFASTFDIQNHSILHSGFNT